MENLKNLRKNKVDEIIVGKRYGLLSEKVKVAKAELISVCSQINDKNIELVSLQDAVDKKQKEIIEEEERQKKILLNLEKVYQEKVKQLDIVKLEQKAKDLYKQQLVLLDRLNDSKEEYSRKAISYNEIINSLSCKEVGLDLTIVSLQKDIDNKTEELQSISNSCKISKEKYIDDEKSAIKKLKDIEDKKENIEANILQLSTKNDELENKWKELKEFEKYITKEEKKVFKKEESVERLFNLLSKK